MSPPEIDIDLELFHVLAQVANARFQSKVVIAPLVISVWTRATIAEATAVEAECLELTVSALLWRGGARSDMVAPAQTASDRSP